MHQSPPPSSLSRPNYEGKKYRKAKSLPTQVLDHCTVCIEEQLYAQAFSLLANSLTAGTGNDHAARIPPTQHLTLAATLVVHPQLTTRTTSADKHAAADDALTYLRLVNHLVGPQNSGLNQALQFPSSADLVSSRLAKRNTKCRPSEPTSDTEDSQIGHIRSPFAKKDSLFVQAEDFWDVVGWACNCSVAHPLRWPRWKIWLDFVLDVLDADLEAALPGARRVYEASGGNTEPIREELKGCLFARFLAPVGEGRNSKRRVMRAVLADGSKQSLAEFGEVWKGETKGPKVKKEGRGAKRRKLDLENGLFGDYFDEESEQDSPADGSRRSRSTTAFSAPHRSTPHSTNDSADSADELHGPNTPTASPSQPSSLASFGGTTSLHLRLRLLGLFSRFCALNPDAFLDTEDLFDLYTEFLRPLPLPVFAALVLPGTRPWLDADSQASLLQMLLRPLLAGVAPAYNGNRLTQKEFEGFYARFAASKAGAGENARVSVCVEGLLRLLAGEGALEGDGEGGLRKAVEEGIKEREARSKEDGRRKGGARAREEIEAVAVLEASAERMRAVLDLAGL